MVKTVNDFVQNYGMPAAGDTVVAGVSGGADSVCLLFLLCKIREKIPFCLKAIHVNHGIRAEAGRDEAYVEKLCAQWQVPFVSVSADVPARAAEWGISEEEAGRKIRYEAFEKELEGAAGRRIIAVAHNENDRAETVLFRLFRGTGPMGLNGIPAVRETESGAYIIRPLLSVSRADIEQFLKGQGIDWCTDNTNNEDHYTRNRIRHRILPVAEEEICAGATAHVAAASRKMEETWDFVSLEIDKAYRSCRVTDENGDPRSVILNRSGLSGLHPFLRKETVRKAISDAAATLKDFTEEHVASVLRLAESGNGMLDLPAGLRITAEYGQLCFRVKSGEKMPCEELTITFPESIEGNFPAVSLDEKWSSGPAEVTIRVFPYEKGAAIPQNDCTKWFDYDKINRSLSIRPRKEGDAFVYDRAGHTKSLRRYMIDEQIPESVRDRIPIMISGERVVWIMGHRISEEFKVSEHTKYILQVQLRGGHSLCQNM